MHIVIRYLIKASGLVIVSLCFSQRERRQVYTAGLEFLKTGDYGNRDVEQA